MTGRKPITYAGTELNRRHFLAGLSLATLAGVGLARCTLGAQPRVAQAATAPAEPPPVLAARMPLPGGAALSSIPGDGNLLALTLDDGANSDVVRLYTQFTKDTGLRLTYFVNGTYRSWTEHRDLLRPLVEAGQIQLGNHTWSHPDLATLPKDQVVDQLRRNHQFLMRNYGVDARPYYRPPYGSHNPAVDTIAAELGYTVPTMWSGSLEDQNVIGEDEIVKMANKYFNPQAIVRTSQPLPGHARLRTARRCDPRQESADRHARRRLRQARAGVTRRFDFGLAVRYLIGHVSHFRNIR